MNAPGLPMADRCVVHLGDSRVVLRSLANNSVDAIVTDPPYGLSAEPDVAAMLRAWLAGQEYRHRSAGGFMGKAWDAFVPGPAVWIECLRVLKPGGHLVAFFGTRTYDLGALAVRLAGFEIRDMLAWLYGSGFPKSLDVSKAIDKAAGAERTKVVGSKLGRPGMARDGSNQRSGFDDAFGGSASGALSTDITAPATPEAAEWEGWGTALKPALEPVVFARKPLIGTVAANVLTHGCGAVNIDGCRIEGGGEVKPRGSSKLDTAMHDGWARPWMEDREEVRARHDGAIERANRLGRWPANVMHDGSDEVLAGFPTVSSGAPGIKRGGNEGAAYGAESRAPGTQMSGFGDSGSAARFFYSAKADADDRLGSAHATVKPGELMAWLVRLVTPPGGVVLDPFAGTGSTGVAALREGRRAILVELEPAHVADIELRLAHARGEAGHSAGLKARNKPRKAAGPLFGDEA